MRCPWDRWAWSWFEGFCTQTWFEASKCSSSFTCGSLLPSLLASVWVNRPCCASIRLFSEQPHISSVFIKFLLNVFWKIVSFIYHHTNLFCRKPCPALWAKFWKWLTETTHHIRAPMEAYVPPPPIYRWCVYRVRTISKKEGVKAAFPEVASCDQLALHSRLRTKIRQWWTYQESRTFSV